MEVNAILVSVAPFSGTAYGVFVIRIDPAFVVASFKDNLAGESPRFCTTSIAGVDNATTVGVDVTVYDVEAIF